MQRLFGPCYPHLPRALKLALTAHTCGRDHCLATARLCLDAAPGMPARHRGVLMALAGWLATCAWEADPLHPGLAGFVAKLGSGTGELPGRVAARPASRALEGLAAGAAGDEDDLAEALERALAREPDSLPPLRLAIQLALAQGRWAHGIALCSRLPEELESIRRRLETDLWLLAGEPEKAEASARRALEAFPFPHAVLRLAEALRRQDRAEAALDLLRGELARQPWRVTLRGMAAELAAGGHAAVAAPSGRVCAVIYSFAKPADLARTLDSLAASDPLPDDLLVLDNGSDPETGVLLEHLAERYPGRVRGIRLPVNIGAPAARNWLAAEPEARAAEWLAYLDDDIFLPPDWLGRFGAALARHPEPGRVAVMGASVVDVERPWRMQSADLHLLEPAAGSRGPQLALPQLQEPELGQFAAVRPCDSVTGCCHLVRRQALEAVGGFDIRYSPSQFDDIDHDLRQLAADREVLHTGHLRVRHVGRTGQGSGQAPGLAQAVPNPFGQANRLKLEAVHGSGLDALLDRVLARRERWLAGC